MSLTTTAGQSDLARLVYEAHADLLRWATRQAAAAESDRDRWLDVPAFVRRDSTMTAYLVSRAARLSVEARLLGRIDTVLTTQLDVWAPSVSLLVGEA